MQNWRDFLLAQTLVIVCAGLPQFTGAHLAAHIASLGMAFLLTWRLIRPAEERATMPVAKKTETPEA
jgi:hypothetical protein